MSAKAEGFYVSVQPGHEWKLIYAGELSNADNPVCFPIYFTK